MLDKSVVKKLPKMSLEETFTEYLDAAAGTNSGYKQIPKHVLPQLLEKVKTEEDVETMKDVLAEILCHRNHHDP